MKTKADEFDFTGIDSIVVHKIDDSLESKDHAVICDKKIIDRLLKYISKSRKYPGKFFPGFKIDLMKNDMTLYEIYVTDNYLNLNGMVFKSSKYLAKIIKKAFGKTNQESNPSN